MSTQKTRGRKLQTATNSEIKITLNDKQAAIVNKMVDHGVYGNTPNQVLLRIVDERLAKELQHAH
jgi:hypothetical protein